MKFYINTACTANNASIIIYLQICFFMRNSNCTPIIFFSFFSICLTFCHSYLTANRQINFWNNKHFFCFFISYIFYTTAISTITKVYRNTKLCTIRNKLTALLNIKSIFKCHIIINIYSIKPNSFIS